MKKISIDFAALDLETSKAEPIRASREVEMSNEELAYHLMRKGVRDHAIYSMVAVDMDRWKSMGWETTMNVATLSVMALQRSRETKDQAVKLASKIASSKYAVLTPLNIFVKESGKEAETIPMIRGTPLMGDPKEERALIRAEHAISAAIQILPPFKEKDVSAVPKCQAVCADPTGEIYPVAQQVPEILRQVYTGSPDVRNAIVNARGICRGQSDRVYCNVMKVLPQFFANLAEASKNKQYSKLISAYAEATNEHKQMYAKRKINEPKFMPAYAPIPQLKMDKINVVTAFSYLLRSRAARGYDAKGRGFNTYGYYYGDIPAALYRPVNMVHNVKRIIAELGGVDGIIVDSTFAGAIPLFRANGIEVYDFMGSIASVPLSDKKYAWITTIHRTVAQTKVGKLQFTPTISELEKHIAAATKNQQLTAKSYGVSITSLFHTVACPEVFTLNKYAMRLSTHAHAGGIWLSEVESPKPKDDFVEIFARRMMVANLYKNYYPFHRVPFVIADDSKFEIFLCKNDRKDDYEIVNYGEVEQDVDEQEEKSMLHDFQTYLDVQAEKSQGPINDFVTMVGVQKMPDPLEDETDVFELVAFSKSDAISPSPPPPEEEKYSISDFGGDGGSFYG